MRPLITPSPSNLKVGVIVATYNKPGHLRASLQSLVEQDQLPDQIVVADDGSGDETRTVIDSFNDTNVELFHIRHADQGFRKCQILNKAIDASSADYLIFIDDDCMCPPWFVSSHMQAAVARAFTVGSSVNLDEGKTDHILSDPAAFSHFLDLSAKQKMRFVEKRSRGGYWKLFLRAALSGRPLGRFCDQIYLGRGVFRGGNSGAWRKDLVAINGFNNEMSYGHEDREIGERLRNFGLSCRQVRYFGANYHLHHERGYADPETKRQQRRMCRQVMKEGTSETPNGFREAINED